MLFRPQKPTLAHPADNDFQYNDDYESVMQFITKNKKIPAKLAEVAESPDHLKNVELLFSAITDADMKHEIFSHPYLEIYILFLLKEQRITILDFLTLKIYDHALMQHTDKQKLKDEHRDVKAITDVDTIPFTDVLEHYVEKLIESFYANHRNEIFDLQRFAQFILLLNKLNQRIICIRKNDDSRHDPYMQSFVNSSPFVLEDDVFYFVPSAGIIHALLNTFNATCPIRIAPVYGSVGPMTLFKMHQKGFHPVSLYSADVASSSLIVHKVEVGPLQSLLHDVLAHVFWGNHLNSNHYALLHEVLAPTAAELLAVTLESLMIDFKSLQAGKSTFGDFVDLDLIQGIPTAAQTSREIYFIYALYCLVTGDYKQAVRLYQAIKEQSNHILEKYQVDLKTVFTCEDFLSRLNEAHTASQFLQDITQTKAVSNDTTSSLSKPVMHGI